MNFFRFLLAMSVATVHFGNPYAIGGISGKIAVELFFVISGYFMESTLTLKYKKWRFFYLNRALRIYPMYLVVLVATFIMTKSDSKPVCDLTVFWKIVQLVSNLSLVGLDFLHFIPTVTTQKIQGNSFGCAPSSLIIVVVAWTLSLEIVFYLLAPIINRLSSGTIFTIWSASLALKLIISFTGKPDPWNYRFFPAELCFFLTGTLFVRIKNKQFFSQDMKSSKVFRILVPMICFTYFILATRFFSYFTVQEWPIILAGILVFFLITQCTDIPDVALLGELSYPVYLCHFLILIELKKINVFQNLGSQMQYLVLMGSTILVSYMIVRLFKPINKVRFRLH